MVDGLMVWIKDDIVFYGVLVVNFGIVVVKFVVVGIIGFFLMLIEGVYLVVDSGN